MVASPAIQGTTEANRSQAGKEGASEGLQGEGPCHHLDSDVGPLELRENR